MLILPFVERHAFWTLKLSSWYPHRLQDLVGCPLVLRRFVAAEPHMAGDAIALPRGLVANLVVAQPGHRARQNRLGAAPDLVDGQRELVVTCEAAPTGLWKHEDRVFECDVASYAKNQAV